MTLVEDDALSPHRLYSISKGFFLFGFYILLCLPVTWLYSTVLVHTNMSNSSWRFLAFKFEVRIRHMISHFLIYREELQAQTRLEP